MCLEGRVVSHLGTCSWLVVIGSCGVEKLILNLGELCFFGFWGFNFRCWEKCDRIDIYIDLLLLRICCSVLGMAQVEKQIKSSQKFLLGLLRLPNFTAVRERQLSQILVVVEKSPAYSTEKAGEILDLLDSSIWDDQILGELKEKIASKTDDGLKERRGMQNFTSLHEFMPSEVWTQLQSTSSLDKRVEAITRFAATLGLRCPSESTLAVMLTLSACLFWQGHFSEQEKYDLLQRYKPKIKKWLQQEPMPEVYLLELPGTWQDFPAGMKEKLFPAGKEPKVPEGLDVSEVDKIVRTFRLRKTKTGDFTTNQPQAQMQDMGSGMNNMLALGSFVAGLIQRPTGLGDVQISTGSSTQCVAASSALQLCAPVTRPEGRSEVLGTEACGPKSIQNTVEACGQPSDSAKAEACGQTQLALTAAAQALEDKVPKKKRPNVSTIQEQLVSLQEGLRSEGTKDKAVVRKKPAFKRPAAAVVKEAKTGPKQSAATLKRPAGNCGTSSGQKAGKAASTCASKEERRKLLLAQVPSKLKARYKDGCATCRYRPGCCDSCWRKRGFEL